MAFPEQLLLDVLVTVVSPNLDKLQHSIFKNKNVKFGYVYLQGADDDSQYSNRSGMENLYFLFTKWE